MRKRPAMTALLAAFLLVVPGGCGRNQVSTEVRIDFTHLDDGPPPKTFGGGPATVISTPTGDPSARFRIENGKLTTDPAVDAASASYFTSAKLPSVVTNIGARWTFRAQRGTPGTMLLMVSQTVLNPPISIQLEVTPNSWSFGIRPPGAVDVSSLVILRSEQFRIPLQQNGVDVYQSQVWIAGDRAEVELPNGERRIIRDPRIAEWAGAFATFVAYATHGRNDSRVGFTAIWADSKRVP